MCNPSDCLPFLRGSKVSTYSTQLLGTTQAEAQGLDDFVEDLCKSLGCADRQAAGKITLLGVVHKNVLEAANKAFPQAKECMAAPIQGIINAVGEAMASCANGQAAFLQSLLTNAAPHIGELLKCTFGPERADQMELQMYRSVTQTTVTTIRPQIGGVLGILAPLLPGIIGAILGGGGGGLCSPGGGGGGLCQSNPPPSSIIEGIIAALCPSPAPPTPPPRPGGGFCRPPGGGGGGGVPPTHPVDIFPKPNDQNRC